MNNNYNFKPDEGKVDFQQEIPRKANAFLLSRTLLVNFFPQESIQTEQQIIITKFENATIIINGKQGTNNNQERH